MATLMNPKASSMTASKTMTKKRLIQQISQEKGIHPTDVRHVVQSFLDKMTDALQGGCRLEFRDFGVFEVVKRQAKVGRNPKNPEVAIKIRARAVVKYTPGKKMRVKIDQTFHDETLL